MTLLQNNKGKLPLAILISLIALLIVSIYYLHIINANPKLGIADKNFVFAITSCFGFALLIAMVHFFKTHHQQTQREKISERFGWVAIITLLGGLFFYAVFGIKTPATWLSDLFIQIVTVAAVGCIAIMPKKGNYVLPTSMVFPLMTIIVYLCYRF